MGDAPRSLYAKLLPHLPLVPTAPRLQDSLRSTGPRARIVDAVVVVAVAD